MHTGGCLCGAVKIALVGSIPAPNACHCSICRKTTGLYLVSTEVKKADLTITEAAPGALRWYQSSPKVRRGFCGTCGSTLFFDPRHRDWIAVAMGAFDGPTGVKITHHIYCADKGDFYDITDGLPQNAQ